MLCENKTRQNKGPDYVVSLVYMEFNFAYAPIIIFFYFTNRTAPHDNVDLYSQCAPMLRLV